MTPHEPQPAARRRRRLGPLLALGVLVGGLLAAELGLRAAQPARPAPDPAGADQWDTWRGRSHRPSEVPGLVYDLVPDLDRTIYGWSLRTNSLGMRDGEPREEADLLRVAAVGDSYTFGFGVDQEQIWPHLLELALDGSEAAGGRPVDVLDFGVSGYSTRDEVVVLEQRALPFEPRVVILQYCVNDPEVRPIQPLHRYFSPEPWWRRSVLATRVVERLQRRTYGKAGGYFPWLHRPEGAPWRGVVEGFDRVRELCAARGIPVVLVIFPILAERPWSAYPYRDLHAQVEAEGARQGFEVLDLLAVYEGEPIEELLISPHDSHPNPRGHALAAEALGALLEASEVLRQP